MHECEMRSRLSVSAAAFLLLAHMHDAAEERTHGQHDGREQIALTGIVGVDVGGANLKYAAADA